jgi:hypothetical protein
MTTEPDPTDHFNRRFNQRFNQKVGFDITKVQLVSKFSTNRYEHPKVMRMLKENRAPKYLVSQQHNIIIPVSLDGRLVTALWYDGKPR